jgi:peroxiredoxin
VCALRDVVPGIKSASDAGRGPVAGGESAQDAGVRRNEAPASDVALSRHDRGELTFTVLSDPGNQLARQLGILTAPSDTARAAQLEVGLDLTQINADGTTGLPMPTVLIAGADGEIRWIDVHADYTARTEPGQVLHAVSQMIAA